MVDDRGRSTIEGKRAILGDGEIESRVGVRKRNLVAEDRAVECNNVINCCRAGNPTAQAAPRVPVRSDFVLIVEAEPARPFRRSTLRVKCYNLQIDRVSKLKPVIMCAHVIVTRAERHIEVEAVLDMRNPFDQRWRDHGDVVKLQQLLRPPMLPSEFIRSYLSRKARAAWGSRTRSPCPHLARAISHRAKQPIPCSPMKEPVMTTHPGLQPSDTSHAAAPSGDAGHHVVVIGAGFGGLQLVHGLSGPGTRITLIDQRNHHLFQPLLYQVATTILATSEIAWPIRSLFRNRPDVTTLLARVCGVDVAGRSVELEDGASVGYDTLVIATGARHAYFGHDEWEQFAPGLKTLEDATTIRRRLLLAFERAERETDPAIRHALLTFSVIGAGPTGVELAGIIAELAKHTLWRDFRRIDTREARVLLIEAGPRVLAAFPEDLSTYAADALKRRGVELWLAKPVTDCTAEGLRIGEDFIPCRTAVWAAGVAASPAAAWLGVEGDRAGRVPVQPDLTLADHPDIFVDW